MVADKGIVEGGGWKRVRIHRRWQAHRAKMWFWSLLPVSILTGGMALVHGASGGLMVVAIAWLGVHVVLGFRWIYFRLTEEPSEREVDVPMDKRRPF